MKLFHDAQRAADAWLYGGVPARASVKSLRKPLWLRCTLERHRRDGARSSNIPRRVRGRATYPSVSGMSFCERLLQAPCSPTSSTKGESRRRAACEGADREIMDHAPLSRPGSILGRAGLRCRAGRWRVALSFANARRPCCVGSRPASRADASRLTEIRPR